MGILLQPTVTTVFNGVEKLSEGTPKGGGLSPNVRWSGPGGKMLPQERDPVNP
jgi:hypothetical protein